MNNNKLYYYLLAMLMLLTACNNKKFEIKGQIAEAKDSLLYLENCSLDGPVVVDSVKLSEEGTFSFNETATEAPEFYRLRIAGQIINISIDSVETVSVKAQYPTMSYKYEVEGSENCSKIKELALLQMGLQSKVNSIIASQEISVATANDSLQKVVNAYKQNIKMNYIFKEPNKSYAYFALFQTLVLGNQQILIFDPHADKDDVKVFAAVATSWDVFHPGAVRGENLHNIAIQGMKDERIVRARQQETYVDADKFSADGIIDLALVDNKGNVRKLSSLKGKVVMLDFCSMGQEGITQRIMSMRELYNKYHAQGFEIYQVSLDGNEHFWKTQTAALPWVSVNDKDGVSLRSYNVQGIPTFFLLDKNGAPYKRDMQIQDIDKEIQTLLK